MKKELLKLKKAKFIEVVKRSTRYLGLDVVPVQFWKGRCPLDKGIELAHIHPNTGVICISESKLEKINNPD